MSTSLKREKSKLINLKVSESEFKLLQRQAKRHSDGNVSALLRFAGINFRPLKAAKRKAA